MLRRILKEASGLNLGEDKQEMLEGKLRPVLKEFALPSLSHLALALLKPGGEHLRLRVAQAVMVQESYFFRDKVPFQYFTDAMLPALMAERKDTRRLRVWCAAVATGQEPYSVAMALAGKERELAGWTVEIVATDFVADALVQGAEGGTASSRCSAGCRDAAGPALPPGRQRLGDRARAPRPRRLPYPESARRLRRADEATKRAVLAGLPASSRAKAISCSAQRRPPRDSQPTSPV